MKKEQSMSEPYFSGDVTIDCASLKTILGIGNVLDSEVAIEAGPVGFSMMLIDPAHITMLKLDVPRDSFQEYRVEYHGMNPASDGKRLIIVDAKFLLGILKFIGNESHVRLKWSRVLGGPHRLTMEADGMTYQCALIDDTGYHPPKVPNLDLCHSVCVNTKVLRTAVRATRLVTDHFRIRFDKHSNARVHVGAKGHNNETVSWCLKDAMGNPSYPKPPKKTELPEALYPSEYVDAILKVIPAPELAIHFGNDYPMEIAANVTKWRCPMKFLIAPRIDGE